jgi:hypothetical protein
LRHGRAGAPPSPFADADAILGLHPAPLKPFEFPGTVPLLESPGRERGNRITNPVGGQSDAVDFVIDFPN